MNLQLEFFKISVINLITLTQYLYELFNYQEKSLQEQGVLISKLNRYEEKYPLNITAVNIIPTVKKNITTHD